MLIAPGNWRFKFRPRIGHPASSSAGKKAVFFHETCAEIVGECSDHSSSVFDFFGFFIKSICNLKVKQSLSTPPYSEYGRLRKSTFAASNSTSPLDFSSRKLLGIHFEDVRSG